MDEKETKNQAKLIATHPLSRFPQPDVSETSENAIGYVEQKFGGPTHPSNRRIILHLTNESVLGSMYRMDHGFCKLFVSDLSFIQDMAIL